jgi:hypothetical protein
VTDDEGPLTRLDVAFYLFAVLRRISGIWCNNDWSAVGLLDRVPVVLMTSVLLGFAYVCGRVILELVGADRRLFRLELFVFSTAVGLNVVSLWILAVGLCWGFGSVLVFAVPGAAVLAFAAYRWRGRWFAATASRAETTRRPLGWLGAGGLFLALPFVVVIVLGAMLPPTDFDVREYHLQVPKEWYQAGCIDFLPHNVYGNMPLGPQILGIPAMAVFRGELDWWWGSLVGKTLLGMFAPLTALALCAAGSRFFSPTAGGIAAVVYISIPWVLRVSMTGLVDGAWAFYVFVALYAALLAAPLPWPRRSNDPAGNGPAGSGTSDEDTTSATSDDESWWPYLLLAGFLAGAAVSCKYPSLVLVVPPLFVWLVVACPWAKWKVASVFLLAVVAGCGPWLGKNWTLTGNPVYPLAGRIFNGATRTPEKIEQWDRAHQVPLNAKGQRWSLSQAGEAVARLGWQSEWLSPLVVPFAILAFFVPRARGRVIWFAAAAFWIFLVWWTASHRIDRFLLPLFPILALLAGVGATWRNARLWRHGVLALLFWVCVVHLLLASAHIMVDSRFLVALDLRRKDPERVNKVHLHLNRAVPDGGRVLLVGDAQPFDLEVPVLYNTCFDDCQFERLMKGRTAAERREELSRRGITHVYVHWGELARYRSEGNYGYSNYVTPEVVRELTRQGILGNPVGDFKRWYGKLYPVEDKSGG